MTNGSSQGLFVVVAVVIFGIFVAISYSLFRDQLTPSLASIFSDSTESAINLLKGTDSSSQLEYLKYTVKSGEVTITGFNEGLPENLVIPSHIEGNPVTIIGSHAFLGAGITSVNLPETLKHIESSAFASNKLKELQLPDNLESMDVWSFAQNQVKDVYLPDNTIFGNGTFAHNINTKLHIKDTNKLYKIVDGVLYSKDGKTLVFYPERTDWKTYTVLEGVEVIGNRAIEHTGLEEVILPSTLKVIDSYGIYSNKLKSIHLPEGLTTVKDYAFASNLDLNTVNIPSTLKSVHATAFDKTKIKFEDLGL